MRTRINKCVIKIQAKAQENLEIVYTPMGEWKNNPSNCLMGSSKDQKYADASAESRKGLKEK